jgi:DNA-binding CsgD family transcriptional regulator
MVRGKSTARIHRIRVDTVLRHWENILGRLGEL